MGSGGRASVHSGVPASSQVHYPDDEDCCSKCVTRVPYATLVALILNWAGVGVFCGTLYRGVNLTLRMLQVKRKKQQEIPRILFVLWLLLVCT